MPSQSTASGVAIARRRDSIIAALPQTAALADGSALVRRVEVAPLPTPLPANAAGVRFSSARVDDHARLTEARLFASLGWEAGTVLAARVDAAGRVALSTDAAGATATVSIDHRRRLCLSVALREVLGAEPGSSVLILPSTVSGTALLVGAGALLAALGALDVRLAPVTKSRPEDRNLAPEQFAEMNQRFYGTKMPPHAYIDRRLRGLFLTAQGTERLPDTFDEPLTIGEVKATWSAPDDDEGEELRDFVTAESTVLLHHAAEALFRLYLAHVGRPACPWLEVARLRTPREFKDRVEEFLAARADEASSEGLMDVFTGHPRPTVAPPDEQWTAVHQGASSLMGHLGRLLLQDGPLYNAAKHGLAVRPGAAAMAFGNQETDLPIKADGPSITHLTIGDSDRGKSWYETTTWVDAERNLALTSLAITQLRALWAVARFRYTEQPWEPSEVRWVTGAAVEAVLAYPHKPDDVRLTVPSMSLELLYYLPEPTK